MTEEDAGEAWLREGMQASNGDSEREIADILESLGATPPAPAAGHSRTPGSSMADAVRELGGSLREQAAALGRPGRVSKRDALARAQAALPDPAVQQHKEDGRRRWFATEWRYHVVSRCGLRKEQARIVALLEDHLDGSETELPDWLAESVYRIIEFDNRRPAEWHPGAISAKDLYERLAAEWHASQAEQ